MTEDFKDKLLKYFTGNFVEGTTSYQIIQSDMTININNLYQTLSSEIGNQYTGEFEISGVLQSKASGDNDMTVNILYGTSTGSTKYPYTFGFIVLIDSEFNILDILTEYSSGIVIGALDVLNVDENGYLYGVETNYNSTQKRFIMLNNVAIKLPNENYQVKIRRAYNIPSGLNSRYFGLIKKEPNGSKYLIAGTYYPASISTPFAVELEIVVGGSNNWTTYEYSSAYTLTSAVVLDLWATWTGGNLDFEILGKDMNTICIFYMDSSTIDVNTYNFVTSDTIFDISGKMYQKDYAFLGIITANIPNNMKHYILAIEPGQSNLVTVYQNQGNYYGTTTASASDIEIKDLDVFYTEMIRQDNDNYYCEVGRIIVNNNYKIIKTFDITALSSPRYYFNKLFITKENNLYTWYLQIENTAYIVKQIFNLDDYNLGAIDNTKYFIPKSANLYNNNEVIFSKNLYNITVNENITTATIEIPNMSLNSTTINGENLIGSSYQELVEAVTEFTKNQYEVVDVNFINTIGIQNKNNETIQEVEGQNRLNDSVSQTTDYEDARMTRYRINYEDGTTLTNSNVWYPIANYFTTNLTITPSKEISSIEFISEDEQTTYTTIYPILEVGKTYKISQDVFLKEKGSPQPVYYNTDEVYYGSDEVYY